MGTILAPEGSQSDRAGTMQPVEVSVVIPCLNEANSLAFCVDKALKAFSASGLTGEVIVADNGSTDGSTEIAEERGARVVRVPERVWCCVASRHRRRAWFFHRYGRCR